MHACVQAVADWGVGYIVLTSVDRDDVPDGGAAHFARTVQLIKQKKPSMLVECLAPDFSGRVEDVRLLAASGLDVFAHNIETVHRLQVRPPLAHPDTLPQLSNIESGQNSHSTGSRPGARPGLPTPPHAPAAPHLPHLDTASECLKFTMTSLKDSRAEKGP